ncbi:DsbA family protein [Acidimangrovimonas sediminis]|uniref:DsbA family protein n=1 Tax=Acidimangrovimonas sediminis TaxID=2056283 RepID=UPI001E547A4A|nr:DsbA family protein [Acidimangrovimonas sediminis]
MRPNDMTRRSFLGAAGLGAANLGSAGLGGAGLGMGLGAGALLVLPGAARADGLTPEDVYRDPDAPVLGNARGDVTIAEFFDYQCPFCKKDYPVVSRFVKADGGVRLVMKDWPIFGPPSVRASHLVFGARELGQYETAFDALMRIRGALNETDVARVLRGAGIDVDKADAAYRRTRAKWDALLVRNAAQARAFGFNGTPAFAIGTVIYPGLMDAEALQRAVDSARG